MTSVSPEQVIRDYLSASSVLVASQPASGTSGWQSETSVGGLDARPETIQFGKMRALARRQVHAVTFTTQAGRRMRFICCVRQDGVGAWQFAGGAGGGADSGPHRGYPWVNLGGGGWLQQFYAGGQVLEEGAEVARVRLRAANGTVLEDTVEDGVVLFLTDDAVQMPVAAELLDGSGHVLSQHIAMG
jgi:hypothetical protein